MKSMVILINRPVVEISPVNSTSPFFNVIVFGSFERSSGYSGGRHG